MLQLDDVTLIGADGVDLPRLLFAADVCRHYCGFGDVKILTPFPCEDPAAVTTPPLTIDDYSRLVVKELHQYVKTSHALIFQHDGFILNPDAWTDEFLEYDYVGAPFWFSDDMNVGNGGFCLRSKRFLQTTSEFIDGPPWTPEDLILCRKYGAFLREKGMKFAPTSLARRFAKDGNSVEGEVWNGQFGFHNFRTTDLSRWQPPPSLRLDPFMLLKRNWEVQRVSTGHASRLRRRAHGLSRQYRRLSRELTGLQRFLRTMLLQMAAQEAGLGADLQSLNSEDLEDLAVEVFSNHPFAASLGVRFCRSRHSDAVPVKADCEARRDICQSRCCFLQVRLTREEVAKPCYRINVANPFTLVRDAKTRMCVHLRDGKCDIYDERPTVCSHYTCVKDRRIWEDFDRMVPGRLLRRDESHPPGQRESVAGRLPDDGPVGDSADELERPEEYDSGP